MRLMLLEDDATLGEGLRDFLQAEGHVVDWFTHLRDVRMLTVPYDALLVDWQLPDGSGLEWLAGLRERRDTTPALMMTARDLLSECIKGLDSGADDYLVKPFAPEELVARLRAVRRRGTGVASARLQFGPVAVDVSARAAFVGDQRVNLTAREWALLEALALRAGRIVAKGDLEDIIMNSDRDISSNALEVHISGLRRKLGRDLIETVRGMGYRINP
jgi:two-component system, OmpR family, response regulator